MSAPANLAGRRFTNWAWDVQGLSREERHVLVFLAVRADAHGLAQQSIPEVGAHTGLTRIAIRRAIHDLRRRMLIEIAEPAGADAPTYRLLVDNAGETLR